VCDLEAIGAPSIFRLYTHRLVFIITEKSRVKPVL
jgi:hypothetical protein